MNTPIYGGSTFSFMWRGDALTAMRQMQGLGLNDFDVVMVPGHLWHDEFSGLQRSEMAALLRRDDVRIESLNLPALDQNLASVVPEARAYAVELFTKAMTFGAELGAKAIVAVPGRVSSLFPPPFDKSEILLGESIEALLKVADKLDQRIYIESHPQTPIPTIEKIEAFLAKYDHPRLQVAYDVSNAEFVSENQAEAIRRIAPRLGQIHLSDGTRTQWRHDRIGLGTVNFEAIEKVLDEVNFGGVRVLEIISNNPIEDILSSQQALANLSR